MLFAAAEGQHHHHHEPNPVTEVQDTNVWPFFEELFHEPVAWKLPVIDWSFIGWNHKTEITKFMVLELIAALLIILIYVPLAWKIRHGGLPRGRFWNFFEVLLTFVRDQIARPNLDSPEHEHAHDEHSVAHGHEEKTAHGAHSAHGSHAEKTPAPHEEVHEADKYVPFLWTLFLFILFCNVLGMFPFMGSPTASIWVTGALAIMIFFLMHAVVIAKHGVWKYLKSLWPVMDMPEGIIFKVMGFFITLLLAVIELIGGVIKSGVLAVRLFANMFAGHLVLANILFFIYLVGNAFGPSGLWGGVTIASVLGIVALSLLELFVAFLQAYIFTFLTALFLGMALQHADHH